MKDYDWVTDEMFDFKLTELVEQMSPFDLLQIPGVYEVVVEELHDEVLSALEEERGVYIDHAMLGSRWQGTDKDLWAFAVDLSERLGLTVEAVNSGAGISWSARPALDDKVCPEDVWNEALNATPARCWRD
jgi:hypothetical protein